jgi:hypothetical protein
MIIQKAVLQLYKNWLKLKLNVNGFGVGYKIKDGKITTTPCILVGVKKKLTLDQIATKDLIPKTLLGVETDVIELGNLEYMWRKKHRPLKMGASACWKGLTACSAGLPVYDKDGAPYMLMNRHCIVPDDNRGIAQIGDAVLNPSPVDGGREVDRIGEVTEIAFPVSTKRNDNIDVALVKLDAPMKHEDVVGTKYTPKTRTLVEALLPGGDVLKNIFGGGRTLGTVKTSSPIISVDFTAGVWGEENGKRVVRYFPHSVLTMNESQEGGACVLGGDSSSIRFIDGMPLVQTFAGSDTVACFNQVQRSLDWIEMTYGLELFLEPPKPVVQEEGWIALGSWMTFNRTEVTIKSLARFRKEPGLKAETLRILKIGDKLQMVDGDIIKDNYKWIKCIRK